MKVYVPAELRHGRSGVEARSPSLHLTSHGRDEEEALHSLRRGIIAWCKGLESRGKLDHILRDKKLKWLAEGDSISVELERLN